MTDATNLVERYRGATGEQGNSAAEQIRAEVLRSPAPDWARLNATRGQAEHLRSLDMSAQAPVKKARLEGHHAILGACLDVIPEDSAAARWVLTFLCDMLREDSSCFNLFEEVLRAQMSVYNKLSAIIVKQDTEQYVADKAAWLLSAIIGNIPHFFSEANVTSLVEGLQKSSCPCSELGVLEALVNMLKADKFRVLLWEMPGVADLVMAVSAQNAPPPYLYKCVFAIWLLSFEEEGTIKLQEAAIVKKIRDILANSRVEKVVRLSLTVLKNFLDRKAFSEQIVELGVLDVVQQLEYEKWRDSEMYDDIRDLSSQISLRVSDMSNFERYERELNEGHLKWGFIHSSKFWAENVLKFEQNDYRALKQLAGLLASTDPTTLAVACHDLGEFVASHPLGKRQIAALGVKEKVMMLMSSQDPDHREVRREALLCCQKIMLNKWQDMDTIPQN